MSRAIAFFDFDGTITTKDSLIEIIRFHKGNFTFFSGMLYLSPWLLGLKLKLVSPQTAKEKVLQFFFGNTPSDQFREHCIAFAEIGIPPIIRNDAGKAIREHLEKGNKVVVVSASPANWVEEWCKASGAECIATILEIKNGHVTGKIEGKNCSGPEKVTRIRQCYDLSQYEEIYCYGNSKGDKEMLSLATFAFYRPFRG
jgi:phosphatidylglycerophosphatase C